MHIKQDMPAVCRYWLQERCTRRACPFAHELPKIINMQQKTTKIKATLKSCQQAQAQQQKEPMQKKTPRPKLIRSRSIHPAEKKQLMTKESPIPISTASRPALLSTANLGAGIRGMALPHSTSTNSTHSSTLFTISNDAVLHAWTMSPTGCITDCTQLHLPCRPRCVFNCFSDPHWLFVGLEHEIRVCHLPSQSQQSLSISSPALSITSVGNLLLAGVEEGSNILVWSFDSPSSSFHAVACLSPPDEYVRSPVLSLESSAMAGSAIVYAGLANGTIQVWDLASGLCCQVLSTAHGKAVTHLLTYCDHLISASQDGSIKLWTVSGAANRLDLQSTLATGTDEIPLALCGVLAAADAPVLFAAYSDCNVHILELPSFTRMATISTSKPVMAMDTGVSHLLLLGDNVGELSIWKWK